MKKVPCPRCGALAPYAPENPWRPFCSERCKVIDLGGWFDETNAIPGEAAESPGGDAPLQREDRDH